MFACRKEAGRNLREKFLQRIVKVESMFAGQQQDSYGRKLLADRADLETCARFYGDGMFQRRNAIAFDVDRPPMPEDPQRQSWDLLQLHLRL